jgi:hypothetical protein
MFSRVTPAKIKLKTSIDGNPSMIYLSIIGFNIELDYIKGN